MVVDGHAEGRCGAVEVVLGDGEAAVLGLVGVGAVEDPDDAGGLGDGGGAEKAVDGGTAVAVEGGAFAQVVGEEDGRRCGRGRRAG